MAEKRMTTASEDARRAIIKELETDGIDLQQMQAVA